MRYSEAKYAESPDSFFGRGCDARLAGHPVEACPYEPSGYAFIQWVAGWRHVHTYWGNLVFGRWAYRPLPLVREATTTPATPATEAESITEEAA